MCTSLHEHTISTHCIWSHPRASNTHHTCKRRTPKGGTCLVRSDSYSRIVIHHPLNGYKNAQRHLRCKLIPIRYPVPQVCPSTSASTCHSTTRLNILTMLGCTAPGPAPCGHKYDEGTTGPCLHCSDPDEAVTTSTKTALRNGLRVCSG